MSGTWQIGLALGALLAPPGLGLLAPLLGVALRGSGAVVIALLCLALAPIVTSPPAAGSRTIAATGERPTAATSDLSTVAGGHRSAAAAGDRPTAAVNDEPAPAASRAGAMEWRGRWRAPPGRDPFLRTDGGDVVLPFVDGLSPPAPGTPLIIRARLDEDGDALAVSVVATGPPSGAWLDRWAAAARARVEALVGRDRRGVVAALLLAQRDELPFPVKADWARLGVSHLLALSGQHVTLLVACWQRAELVRVAWGTALLVGSFVLVTGAGAPLVRSALGFGLLALGLRTARRAPGLRRLAVVALLMEAWEPGLHLQLSAQLSFLAVGGLIAAAGVVRPPIGLLLAPCGAFLATAPLCAETFGRVAPCGLLATPLLVPFVALILGLGLIAVLPGALFAVLDPLTGPLLDHAADMLLHVAAWLARVAPAPWHPPAPPLPGCLLGLLVVVALAVLARLRRAPARLADLVP